jgi:hypothetical protein
MLRICIEQRVIWGSHHSHFEFTTSVLAIISPKRIRFFPKADSQSKTNKPAKFLQNDWPNEQDRVE